MKKPGEKGRGEKERRKREGDWGGDTEGKGRLSSKKLEGERKKTIDGVGKKTTASPIKAKFFFSVLFCFFGHGQSVTLAFVECVMNYTPPLLLLCLCCGGAPAVCTSYNILCREFSMPVYRPGFF